MLFYLLILLTMVPVLELLFIIRVGNQIGGLNTLLLLVVIGIVGAALARLQGFTVLRNIQKNLEQGTVPTEDMLDGFFIFGGGVLLVIPGFLTDIIGLIFLIPPSRALLKLLCKKRLQHLASRGEIITLGGGSHRQKRGYEKFEDADFS